MLNRFIYNSSMALRRLGVDFHEENDPRVLAMRRKIADLGCINFDVQIEADGKWSAESVNLDGIITGGDAYPADMADAIKDAIFTYFGIPPHLCNDRLLRGSNEPVRLRERIYV